MSPGWQDDDLPDESGDDEGDAAARRLVVGAVALFAVAMVGVGLWVAARWDAAQAVAR